MPRKPTGSIIEPRNGRAWALRFRAYGERRFVTLGTTAEGWSREQAEAELRHVLADVERGIWQPSVAAEPEAPKAAPSFHEFSTEWLRDRTPEVAPRTVKDYEWALSHHLLPVFARHTLSQISVQEVDRYKSAKAREGQIAPAQINKTLKILAQIWDSAKDYGLVGGENPARGRRRRLKAPKPQRTWVEPEQIPALIDCSAPEFRPVVATLIGGGMRNGEAMALSWRDVSLATGTITVGRSKTDAGSFRQVDIPRGLVDVLAEWKARTTHSGAGDPVFVTLRGTRQCEINVCRNIKAAIRAANRKLAEIGIEPISERVTPHSLRRTYVSLRAVAGDDLIRITEQTGHSDPRVTIDCYAKAYRRRDKLAGPYLREFDRALEWAAMGSDATPESDRADAAQSWLEAGSALESDNHG